MTLKMFYFYRKHKIQYERVYILFQSGLQGISNDSQPAKTKKISILLQKKKRKQPVTISTSQQWRRPYGDWRGRRGAVRRTSQAIRGEEPPDGPPAQRATPHPEPMKPPEYVP